MKIRNLLYLLFSILTVSTISAQNVIVIEGGGSNAGLLETTINGDTTATGERADPNRIYELKADEFYIQHSAINVNNPSGTITIRGQEGGGKPVILKQPLEEVNVGENQINSSLTVQNIQYHNQETDGTLPWQMFNIIGADRKLIAEDLLIENCNGIIFNLNNVPTGAVIKVRNSYFRDFHNFGQWWAGRVVQAKVPVDTFLFENNTVTGAGLLVLGQNCLFDYSVINHNTFINTRKYPFLNQYWKECYFTNNLFINANMVGEDRENVATGGQDPDALLHGIMGIDTIEPSLAIQGKYLNADSTVLSEEVDEFSDIIFYAADNVITSSTSLDNYYSGGLSSDFDDAPSSYLTWGGVEGPFKVVSVPGIWKNERSAAIIEGYTNIVEENNSVYEFKTEELGFTTDPLPQSAADPFIQWNQAQWGVPGIEVPTKDAWVAYQFGDFDPLSVPGIETETAASGSGGITKISDMVEDFTYTKDLTSASDGLPIGALHWADLPYDGPASIAAVKAAYTAATISSVKELVPAETYKLQNSPNPFNDRTQITFDLPKASSVSFSVFDMSGMLLSNIKQNNLPQGSHSIWFDSKDLSSGTYIYRLATDEHIATRKMAIVK